MPILLLVFVVVPLVEFIVLLRVSEIVGWGWAILGLLAVSIVGAVLVKREGLRAWQRFRESIAQGRMPAEEVVDGALLVFAAALLLTPGYMTDAVGLLLLFPLTRGVINRALRTRVRRSFGLTPAADRRQEPGRAPDDADEVIDVEVIDVERTPPDDDPP